jgi:ribonuclease I (enterobacter ribonuclease)
MLFAKNLKVGNPKIMNCIIFGLFLVLYAESCFAELKPEYFSDFDSYVFALSLHSGFCHTKIDALPPECQLDQETQSDLVAHGLWPSLPKSFGLVMQYDPNKEKQEGMWRTYGCYTQPFKFSYADQSRKCNNTELQLSEEVKTELSKVMPGVKSCLEKYEFAKHGVCFGFDHNEYFKKIVELTNEFRNSDFGKFLQSHKGHKVKIAAIVDSIKNSRNLGDTAVKSMRMSCKDNELIEFTFELKAEEINNSLSSSSFRQTTPYFCGEKEEGEVVIPTDI